MWLTRNEVRIPIRIPAVVVIPLFLCRRDDYNDWPAIKNLSSSNSLSTSTAIDACIRRGEMSDWLTEVTSRFLHSARGLGGQPQSTSANWILLIVSEIYGIRDSCKLACHVCNCPWPTCLIYNAYIPNGRPLIPSVTLIAADRPSLLWCSQNVQT